MLSSEIQHEDRADTSTARGLSARCSGRNVFRAFAMACAVAGFGRSALAADTPSLTKLEIQPTVLELSHARDSRSVIVTGVTSSGLKYDLTSKAKLSLADDIAVLDADRFVVPRASGETRLVVRAGGLEASIPVRVKTLDPRPVDFASEVNPIMSKVGCNQGTCHGSQKGQNGFKLSLRGYDALYDYRALIDDVSGRRFNRSMPGQSLMLLKPTQGVPHEGGFLFDEKSRYYKVIEQWVAEGCRFNASPPKVSRLEVTPEKPLLQDSKGEQQLIVIAHFTDGSSRDVTREAVFDSSDFEIATVSQSGRISGVRRGEAAALVRYEGNYAAAPITILGERAGYRWVAGDEYNYVDKHVNVKLRRMKLLASELTSDAEFLRRVHLDLAGVPPTIAQQETFLADERDSRVKRQAKIDELLAGAEYVDHWTLKWSDLLLNHRKAVTEKGVWAFRNWIRKSIAENKPYNRMAFELITASGSTFDNPAANYYRVAREPKVVMENMTQVFLGTRFNCNQCHDHPFERWTQQQYYELSAFFADVGRRKGPVGDEIIFTAANSQPVKHPNSGEVVKPSFPFTHEGMGKPAADARQTLARWLTAKENPYFARSIVNRYWSYFHGRGIIDPVDDIRASNPPSNPELLDALTQDFVAHHFDLKHLIRTIVSSHTYQRSFRANDWNTGDTTNFSHASARRLSAEQLFDSIMVATGAPRQLPGVPAGFRAAQLPDTSVQVSFLDMFGRPPRESPCECERSGDVSLGQTLNLVNGPTIANAIIHPQGLIATRFKEKAATAELIDDIYKATLCRPPTPTEKAKMEAYFSGVPDKQEAAQDLMWALINSPGFLFNR